MLARSFGELSQSDAARKPLATCLKRAMAGGDILLLAGAYAAMTVARLRAEEEGLGPAGQAKVAPSLCR